MTAAAPATRHQAAASSSPSTLHQLINPSAYVRRVIIACFVTWIIGVGGTWWWTTTSVERLSLPLSGVRDLVVDLVSVQARQRRVRKKSESILGPICRRCASSDAQLKTAHLADTYSSAGLRVACYSPHRFQIHQDNRLGVDIHLELLESSPSSSDGAQGSRSRSDALVRKQRWAESINRSSGGSRPGSAKNTAWEVVAAPPHQVVDAQETQNRPSRPNATLVIDTRPCSDQQAPGNGLECANGKAGRPYLRERIASKPGQARDTLVVPFPEGRLDGESIRFLGAAALLDQQSLRCSHWHELGLPTACYGSDDVLLSSAILTTHSPGSSEALRAIADILASLDALVPPPSPLGSADGLFALPARAIPSSNRSGNVTLSFVLLNEDASMAVGEGEADALSGPGSVTDWEIERALDGECGKQTHGTRRIAAERSSFLSAFLEPHLSPLRALHDFRIESQVLHHAPLKFKPARDEAGKRWIVLDDQMKRFVNQEQWSLGERLIA